MSKRSASFDWEADTIIGKNHHQAIVSLVDRKTKYCVLAKVSRQTAELVAGATIARFGAMKDCVKTITSDNGREFTNHEQIAEALAVNFYFARPYHS